MTGKPLRHPPRRPASAHVRVREAAARLEKARARAAAAARKAAAREAAGTGPGRVANITDPHSRLMPVRGGGFIQGYNAQAARSADGLIVGGLVTAQTTDYACFGPLLEQIEQASDLLRAHARGPIRRTEGPRRDGAGRRRVPVTGEPDLPGPGPADRHRPPPRPDRRPRPRPP